MCLKNNLKTWQVLSNKSPSQGGNEEQRERRVNPSRGQKCKNPKCVAKAN